METRYTPLNIKEFEKKYKKSSGFPFNTVLLAIATLTAFVLVVLLMILIQKKMQTKTSVSQESLKTISPTKKPLLSPTVPVVETPTTEPAQKISASPSGAIVPSVSLVPTVPEATKSTTLAP